MSELMNNECLFSCKSCGTVVTARWSSGLFKTGWQLKDSKGNCPMCHKPIRLKGLETAKCPHCGKLVERTEDNRCLSCHKTLQQACVRGHVECPECGMMVAIPQDSRGDCACSICGTVLSAVYINQKLAGSSVETEQYIRLPDVARMLQEDRAIWKHPQTAFPFKSRMQVSEGTCALFLQNGRCMEPCAPGSYLLEDSELERTQKFDAAMENSSTVFNTDIYCILQDLPEMNWGASVEQFQNRERTAVYCAGGNGRIVLQVCDAKAYARYLGFKPVSISSLMDVNDAPGSQDGALVQTARDMISESMYACLNGMDGEALEQFVPNDVRDRLTMELNRRLAQLGMCVKTLWINALNVSKTGGSVVADQIRACAQAEFNWSVKGARVNVRGDRALYAELDFDGTCRLRIVDEARFFETSEVRDLVAQQQISQTGAKDYFQRKVQDILKNALAIAAQEQIDRGVITDILDRNQYVFTLRERARDCVNQELGPEGLALSAFSVNMPTNVVRSDALSVHLEQPQRRQAVRRAVESALSLKTNPIRVHLKDDKSVYVDLSFRGLCRLRLRDEETFFAGSDVQGFMEATRFPGEAAVTEAFARKIEPVFREVLSRITQSVVDQTNADVREISRFTFMLKESVLAGMAPRIDAWGLEMESLDMDGVDTVAASPNLDKQAALEETRSGLRLDDEIRRLQNDHVLFVMEEDGRVSIRGQEISDSVAAKTDEIALRRLERERQYEIAKLQKGADLDALVDEIAEGKRARAGAAALEEYKRKFRIREEELNQKIREERIAQEGEIDAQSRKQRAEFESRLNEAENKRALNDIMRKIAESDLDWRQKLDEYDRLRRCVGAETEADVRRIQADADLKIQRDKDEWYYETAGRKIRLDAEEAELLERVRRYAEDRKERETQANEARMERSAMLDFERRLQERREQTAQQIEKLKLEYDHELAMRGGEIDLEKLRAELQYHTAAGAQGADVQKAQARADADARIAEAQAAARRMEEQLKREESLADRAEEFKKSLLEIQTALEMTRLGIDRNRDDRYAEVAVATAQAVASQPKAAAGMTGEEAGRFRDLEKKVDGILDSVKDLRGKLRTLKKMVPAAVSQPSVQPATTWSPKPSGYAPVAPVQPGAEATRPCPTCGQAIDAHAQSCPFCGTPIL